MAKTISDEQIKFSIIINGNEAQKELFDLEKSTRKLNEENKALGLQKQLLIKQGKQESEQYKELTTTMRLNTTEINSNKAKMKELQNQIGITGLTMSQLSEKAKLLRFSLLNAIPGSEAHKKYSKELGEVTSRLDELRNKSATAKFSLGSLADGFNRYSALGASVLAIMTGVVLSIQKIIDINGKLSDAQADVMKTTGMTKKEVDELTKSFGLLETRTSRIDLLKIGEQGGRLGIPKGEIQDFVKTMNMAAVSLGDSFTGGVDEVAEKLGKIKFLFKETKDMNVEQAYNSIGSAINDLGANGTANEANIAEFTKRIGSLTDVLKPSVQETLALGTAFEESGIEAETSSRAYNIFMKQASTESAKFAKVMGLSQKAVEGMINTNPMNFMLDFAKGMNGMNATEVAKTLDYLGVNADGANKVIGAMGNNFDRFHQLIDLSNKSFSNGTSLINEYNIKNNDLAATLEKINKRISGWFSSETFIAWLSGAVEWISKFIGASEDADGSVSAWKNTLVFMAKVIAVVTAALVTNVGWQELVALWTNRNTEANLLYTIGEKTRAFVTGLSTIATQAQALAVAWATGETIAAREATLALSAAMKTTPWGFLLSALAAGVVAYQMFSKQVDIAANVQKTLADVELETTKAINKEKSELELLSKIAKDEALSKEKRLEAIKKLNDLIPDYIGLLTLENIKNSEGIGILQKYTEEIYKNARAKSVANQYQKLSDQRVEIEGKSLNNYQSGTNEFFNGKISDNLKGEKDIWKQAYQLTQEQFQHDGIKFKEGTVEFYRQTKFNEANLLARVSGALKDKNLELANVDAQMKALEPEVVKNKIVEIGKPTPKTKSDYNIPAGKDENKKDKKYDDGYINDELKLQEELYKLRKKAEEDRISLMNDGYEKDLAMEKLNSEAKIQEFNFQSQAIVNLTNKLDKDLTAAQKAGDIKKIASIENQKKLLLDKEKAINELRCYEEEKLNVHIGIIEANGAKKAIDKSKEAFDQAKILRETKFNEDLATLGNNEIAKQRLRKQFEISELAENEKFLKELIDKFNTIVGKGKFQQMDMSLLTPEQVEEFKKEAEKVGLTLSELIAKKNELSGKQSKENASALGISKGETDIFGFTLDNWATLFDNLKTGENGINSMVFAVEALSNMYSKYSEYLAANENAQLSRSQKNSEAKKKHLKSQLDNGYINQVQYKKGVEKIENDLEDQKAEIEYKQAKRKKEIDIVNTIINTAVAIMQAYSQLGPIGGTIAAVLIGTLGALQINTIRKTPLPARGHEEGLYPDYVKREQDGKVFKSKYGGKTKSGMVNTPTYFLAGENNKPEMVIDNKAWTNMSPGLKDSLVRELRGVKGFEQGYYKQNVLYTGSTNTSNQNNTSSANENEKMMLMMMGVLADNTAVMKDLRENGVIGKFLKNDLKSAKYIKESIEDYDKLRNKNIK